MVDIIKRKKSQIRNLQIGAPIRTAKRPAPVRESAIAVLGRVAIQTADVVGKELHQKALKDSAKQRTLAQTNRPLDNPTVAGVKSAALHWTKIFIDNEAARMDKAADRYKKSDGEWSTLMGASRGRVADNVAKKYAGYEVDLTDDPDFLTLSSNMFDARAVKTNNIYNKTVWTNEYFDRMQSLTIEAMKATTKEEYDKGYDFKDGRGINWQQRENSIVEGISNLLASEDTADNQEAFRILKSGYKGKDREFKDMKTTLLQRNKGLKDKMNASARALVLREQVIITQKEQEITKQFMSTGNKQELLKSIGELYNRYAGQLPLKSFLATNLKDRQNFEDKLKTARRSGDAIVTLTKKWMDSDKTVKDKAELFAAIKKHDINNPLWATSSEKVQSILLAKNRADDDEKNQIAMYIDGTDNTKVNANSKLSTDDRYEGKDLRKHAAWTFNRTTKQALADLKKLDINPKSEDGLAYRAKLHAANITYLGANGIVGKEYSRFFTDLANMSESSFKGASPEKAASLKNQTRNWVMQWRAVPPEMQKQYVPDAKTRAKIDNVSFYMKYLPEAEAIAKADKLSEKRSTLDGDQLEDITNAATDYSNGRTNSVFDALSFSGNIAEGIVQAFTGQDDMSAIIASDFKKVYADQLVIGRDPDLAKENTEKILAKKHTLLGSDEGMLFMAGDEQAVAKRVGGTFPSTNEQLNRSFKAIIRKNSGAIESGGYDPDNVYVRANADANTYQLYDQATNTPIYSVPTKLLSNLQTESGEFRSKELSEAEARRKAGIKKEQERQIGISKGRIEQRKRVQQGGKAIDAQKAGKQPKPRGVQ